MGSELIRSSTRFYTSSWYLLPPFLLCCRCCCGVFHLSKLESQTAAGGRTVFLDPSYCSTTQMTRLNAVFFHLLWKTLASRGLRIAGGLGKPGNVTHLRTSLDGGPTSKTLFGLPAKLILLRLSACSYTTRLYFCTSQGSRNTKSINAKDRKLHMIFISDPHNWLQRG